MSFGFQVFRANGTLLYDGAAVGLTFKDAITLVGGGGSGGKAYPELAGFEILHNQMSLGSHSVSDHFHAISVDYSPGYPVVYWTLVSPSVSSMLYVFAR